MQKEAQSQALKKQQRMAELQRQLELQRRHEEASNQQQPKPS